MLFPCLPYLPPVDCNFHKHEPHQCLLCVAPCSPPILQRKKEKKTILVDLGILSVKSLLSLEKLDLDHLLVLQRDLSPLCTGLPQWDVRACEPQPVSFVERGRLNRFSTQRLLCRVLRAVRGWKVTGHLQPRS